MVSPCLCLLITRTTLSSAVKLPSGKISHHVQCTMGKLYSNTRLLAGKYAGHFTEVGRVSKSHRCNRLCCEDPSCDVAYMVGPSCFLVKCNSEAGCRTVPDLAPAEAKSQLPTSLQFVVKRKFGVMLDDREYCYVRHRGNTLFFRAVPRMINIEFPTAASPEIQRHTVWRTWLFHSLLRSKMIILPNVTTSLIHFVLKGWENVLF